MKNGIWLFIIAVIILGAFMPSFARLQDLKQKNSDYEQEIRGLRAQNEALLAEQKLLIEDPVYLEKVAREKMGLIRSGEVV